jgi:hypothetical protein
MEGMSAFTFKDPDGFWTETFARSGIPEAGAWRTSPPTWHVEVKTTRGPLRDEIVFSSAQFEKVPSLYSSHPCDMADFLFRHEIALSMIKSRDIASRKTSCSW